MINSVQKSLHELLTKLDADTYAKMCNDRDDREELEKMKNSFYQDLRVESKSAPPSRTMAMSFAKACMLHEQYKRTVGEPHEILSNIELATLPQFTVSDNPEIKESLPALFSQWNLGPHDLAEIESSVAKSIKLLEQRRKTVDWLRSLVTDKDGVLDQTLIFSLFSQLFPDHPLDKEQVNLIATRTGFYWLIPKKPSDEKQNAWVNHYDRFSFNRFVHFPMFGGFEIRDSSPEFIQTAMSELSMDFHDTTEVLNSVIAMQRTEDIEKYIIHDTWGHIWQADLTGFRDLYDKMESLRRPMEASMSVTYPCGNVVCLADLYFPEKDQTIVIDEDEATTFVKEWVNVHTTAILAPLIAEMTADIIEYKFVLDHPNLEEKMPSSSVFKNDPAKFDFAWVDFSYFTRELRKIHRAHFKDVNYQESFNQRLLLLIKDRYQYRLGSWSDEQLQEQVQLATQSLLEKFKQVQEDQLSNKTEYIDKANYFFRKLFPLLSLQATVNHFIDHDLSSQGDQQTGHFELLVLFLGIAFCDWRDQPEGLNFPQWAQQFSEQLQPFMTSLPER